MQKVPQASKWRGRRPRSFDGKVIGWMNAITNFAATDLLFATTLKWFILALVAVFLVSLLGHGIYISAKPIDYLFMTEQGWRLAQGQIPYRDFITPIGPIYYFLIGAVEHLTSGNPTAYRFTGFMALLLFGPGLIWISWRRMRGNMALLIALYFAIMPISPREMDGLFFDFAFLALYNTLSWPLMATVMLGALFPVLEGANSQRSADQASYRILDGVATGIAILALLSLKLPHGIVALGIVCLAFILQPRNRAALTVALAVVIAGIIVGYICAGDLLQAYIANIKTVSQANDLLSRLQLKLHLFVYDGRATFFIALLTIWLIEKYRQHHPTKIAYADVGIAVVILLATYADSFNDNEDTPASIPLLLLFLWQVANRVMLPFPSVTKQVYRRVKASLTVLPVLIWAGLPLASDGLSVIFHSISVWLRPESPWPTDLPAGAPQLSRLKIFASAGPSSLTTDNNATASNQYLAGLQEAVTLLRQDHLDQSKIYEARFNNVLSWLLHAPSPRGVLAWLDPTRTFSEAAHPPADTYLQDVDVLMVSKLSYDLPWSTLFQSIYGAAIARDFTLIHNTGYWQIYRRHPSS